MIDDWPTPLMKSKRKVTDALDDWPTPLMKVSAFLPGRTKHNEVEAAIPNAIMLATRSAKA